MNPITSAPRARGARASFRILVVEHHLTLAECLRAYLQVLGHIVEVSTGMSDACERLREHEFDVLLSDVYLPEGTCFFLLQDGNPHLPPFVVTMSGFHLEPAVVGQFGRVRHHLVKPFDPVDLDALLEEFASERARAKLI